MQPFELQSINSVLAFSNVYAHGNECHLHVSDPSEGVSCSVQFLTPTSSAWSVSGQCNVSKAYSSLGTYICQWYQTLQVST